MVWNKPEKPEKLSKSQRRKQNAEVGWKQPCEDEMDEMDIMSIWFNHLRDKGYQVGSLKQTKMYEVSKMTILATMTSTLGRY